MKVLAVDDEPDVQIIFQQNLSFGNSRKEKLFTKMQGLGIWQQNRMHLRKY